MPDIYVSGNKKNAPAESVLKELGSRTNPFSAYLTNPKGISFDTQEAEEKIILFLRKHWITNVPWILLSFILFFGPIVFRFFPIIDFLPERFQLMSIVMYYLMLTAFVLEKFLTWFFNVYIVTDERIVDVDFINLIYKQITEAKNDKIQDTTYRVGGVVRSLFNYGDVLIQTASAQPNLEFEAVPHPDKVVQVLDALRTQEEIEVLEGRVR